MKRIIAIYLFRKKNKSRHNPTSFLPPPKDENGKLAVQGIP